MNKKIIVIGGIVIVIAGLIAFFANMNNGSSGNTGTAGGTGTLPLTSSTPPAAAPAPTGTTITLGTADGSVTMNNFYTATGTTVTQDGQAAIINDTNDYAITYNVSDSSFVISLLSAPLNTARQEAEAAFLSELGISKTDACKLTVYEGVPISVSDEYAGENFPLSFCGGPTSL